MLSNDVIYSELLQSQYKSRIALVIFLVFHPVQLKIGLKVFVYYFVFLLVKIQL